VNKKLLQALKADLKAAETARKEQDSLIDTRRRQDNGEPYGNEAPGKSAIVSRDIRRQREWQHATIIDPFVSNPDIIKCNPVTWEDKQTAVQSEIILNTQFCRQFNRYSFMDKAVKILDIEGTVIVQTGWEYEEEEMEVDVPITQIDPMTGQEMQVGVETQLQMIPTVNKPTAKVCRSEDIFIDPTCEDTLDNAQFVIYRYESDMSSLKQDGRYKNLNKIKLSDGDDSDYDPEDETDFKFSDEPRRKLVVYEYWGNYDVNGDGIAEPIVCSWVGDTVIRMEDNPFPDKKIPFIIAQYSAIPYSIYGESNGDLIGDSQKIKTAILRGVIDNMAQSTNGQKGIQNGALDYANQKRFLNGQNFIYNATQGTPFYEGHYNQIPSSVFEVIGLVNSDIESITGTNGFSNGLTGKSLGSTATGIRGTLDATATRKLNIVRNIAENLVKPIMRKWMSYNSEFLDEGQVFRLTNNEFIAIKKDDVQGNIDIDIQISTSEDNKAKAQELAFMLQTGQQTMDPGEVRIIRAEIARLQKMPELAKKIEEYQPQPDPMAAKMQELQIAKLEAEIANERAKGMENAVDVELKKAKTQSELAKAAEIKENADMKALEFVEREQGIDHQKDLEKQQRKTEGELMKERARALSKSAGGNS
jgi:hypothetical protein